ncbi:Membrane protease subunit, stomatin/prohibitin family, contains C-terminal Zn-ribbon domain [Andreprevotia lacus DSM 23236]|jgi:membrane protease subunit (stomatin/prohibitin family)|uniref:Membrane protease subunit, stomatin/prohibitin family, contains C-terminal Zn-ribbon domain n=1 Tax=Andreprevotia lacus DSM 23236 TaxID=1121001 RepID=A0A1W1XR43_9NEIS|nr:SPFH domain-containing protein [Andreprevotia lacus]SMC26460.1 Membrane protease subunit, stomatin/prohibitin family, contains C-terminal Zn-ribbon domain [Andreprevotia lacus DSM 23236]
MGLGSFIKKQFIDVLQWNEDGDGVLSWRFPMEGMEIQNGGSLTVRESQLAVFINEGQVADVFGPGMHKLTTQTLPVLTYLKNWDKLFESPFKSDVYFFSTRVQLGRKWGTPQPITVRDADFGMVRLRAFGVYSYKLVDPKLFFSEISGTRDIYTRDDLEQQLRNLVVSSMTTAIGGSGVPFLDMAGNQGLMAEKISEVLAPTFAKYGLALDNFAVENISLPEELQKAIDTRISMGMVGDMQKFTQYQTAQAIPLAAQNEGGLAGLGAGLAAGVGFGQVMGNAMQGVVNPQVQQAAPVVAAAGVAAAAAPAAADPLQAKLAQLKGLLDQGLITQADFDTAKAEVLKKLIG